MAVTLRDLAIATGLSKPTVARVLRDAKAPFRPETRQRVFDAARNLGYRPNAAARAINNGRFGNLVLTLGMDPGRSHLLNGLIEGIELELMNRDMSLVVARLPDEQLTSRGFIPRVLRQNMADGMMINYWDIPPEMLQIIHESHMPVIWLNTKFPTDSVYPDDFGGARRAAVELYRLGHRRIAFLQLSEYPSGSEHYSWNDRREGYRQAITEMSLSPMVVEGNAPIAERVGIIRGLLRREDRPTAIIATSESAAVHVVYEALYMGLSIPKDLSVYGIVEKWKPHAAGMYLHTLIVPGAETGGEAVRRLIERIANPDQPRPSVAVPMILLEGATCGPVRA